MFTKEEAKQKLTELIEKHQRHKNEGKLKGINEENTKDYIDELFRILGWDFTEDIIKEYGTGKRKRVDYAFQINGTTKFLLEAKSYNESMNDTDHIRQVLEYGYQNNKTWVVLSNFREIVIYNAKYYDKEDYIRRLFEPIRIEDAVVRIDDLWVLSKEGMKESLINQVATKYGKVKPKEDIDSLIFEDLMRWRKSLEKAIRDHERLNRLPTDPEAAEKYIDEAVQKILDRIIFVRVCEDRGLEEEELLLQCVRMWKEDKKRPLIDYINRMFSKKNGEYNSGLFYPHYSEQLTLENEVLEKIIEESYVNPNGLTYDFSAIDADILGTIYENYLAYIQKRVRDKETKQKSKRKAQGIYYTPTYIVDYIVKNTLGEKLKECKTPEDALKIKVLDPACGSGSFLIRAYDEFRHWFSSYQKGNGKNEQTRLDASEKGVQTFMDRVLESCIYGVDLDAKAVEIAQLNLLLKAAEGKHKLPTLNHTIQCGNSLIDDPAVAGERAFKWEDKFPEVFRNGGFDVMIGNPPYVRVQNLSYNEIDYYKAKYKSAFQRTDIYLMFYEKALKLVKDEGFVGFISSLQFINSDYGKELRKFLLNYKIKQIIDFSSVKVFSDATTYTGIFIIEKSAPTSIAYKKIIEESEVSVQLKTLPDKKINHKSLSESSWVLDSNKVTDLIQKIYKNQPLTSFASVSSGAFTGLDNCFFLDETAIKENKLERDIIKPVILGKEPKKWVLNPPKTYSIYPYKLEDGDTNLIEEEEFRKKYPNAFEYLSKNKNELIKRRDTRKTFRDSKRSWYAYTRKGLLDFFNKEKIIVGYIVNNNNYCLDQNRYIIMVGRAWGIIGITIPNEVLMGVLNSKIALFIMKLKLPAKQGGYFKISSDFLNNFPIPFIKQPDKMKHAVDRAIQLTKNLREVSDQNSNEAQRLKAEIEKTDAEIDRLVYELYGLTAEEIKIVEDSIK